MCVVLCVESLIFMVLFNSGFLCSRFEGKTPDKHGGDIVVALSWQNLRIGCG